MLRNLFISLLTALLLSMPCMTASADNTTDPTQAPPTPVSVITLREENFIYTQEFAGIVEALQSVQIRAQVDGILKKRHYEEGQWVEKDTLLFSIDDAEYATQAEMAAAQVRQSEASYANAVQEYRRAANLQEKNSISPREYDTAVARHAQARASLAETKAALNNAHLKLEKTKIRAPISGYTDMAYIQNGSLIVAASQTDSLLTKVNNTQSMRVLFHVPGVRVRAINRLLEEGKAVVGDVIPAELFEDMGVPYAHTGRLVFGSGVINPQTGTMTSWAEFPNPDSILLPGQIVRIRLSILEFPNALVLPQSAVQQGADGSFVAIVTDDNTVDFAPVAVSGPYGNSFLLTPSEHIKAGSRVIIEGGNKIRSGMPVEARPYAEKFR